MAFRRELEHDSVATPSELKDEPTTPSDDVEKALAVAFRQEWGRIVAILVRRTGDWDLAEECAQEAIEQALATWPRTGVPTRPGAWLMTVARNRAVDRLRRSTRESTALKELADMDIEPSNDELSDLEGDERVRTACPTSGSDSSLPAVTPRSP